MKMTLRSMAVLALCILVSIPPAHAWGNVGHMAVAWVAWQQLTPATQKRVVALLKKNPYYKKVWKGLIPAGTFKNDTNLYIFMMAATWPDEIKGDKKYKDDSNSPPSNVGQANRNTGYRDKYMHKYWHFIDTPFSSDGTSLPAIPAPNAETQIGVFRKVLASNSKDALKSYDLSWILHLVGDVHQPLHCTTRIIAGEPDGDQGGNLVKLSASPGKLHFYWDDLPGVGDTKDFQMAVTYAQTLSAAGEGASDANEADWIQEGVKLAQTSVYISPIGPALGPYTIDDAYDSNSHKIAQRQVVLAGARLANLLNAELK